MPLVRIDKEYRFTTDEGTASIADLFRGRSQLLIYHFMFGPEYTAGCPSCSAIADGFDGSVVHLANHDVTLCAVSRAPLAKLQAYKRRMGWSFPWASSFDSDFNYDSRLPLLLGVRRLEVVVEVAVERRRPGEAPAHPPLVRLQFRERSPRHRAERDVVIREVDDGAVEAVRDRRAGRTPCRVLGPEHE